MPWLTDEVRETAARIAAQARSVRIDPDALAALAPDASAVPGAAHDPERTYLDGSEEDVARYFLAWDAINFGSGWFPTLSKRALPDGRTVSGASTLMWNLADAFRAHGAWSNAQLRATTTAELAEVLGQPADHELIALHAQALRDLGRWLGNRTALDAIAAAGGSAERLAEQLVHGMALFNDPGFYKRAQITASDLALAGVADFRDLDRLTIFADNLVPHVLRCEGVLVYDEPLSAHIAAERTLPPGPWEREIRGCAVHATEQVSERTGVPPRVLDMWLWHRGQQPEYKARPRHRSRNVFY